MRLYSTANLEDLTDIQSGYAFRSKEYTEVGHFLMRIGNVQDARISLDKPKFVRLDSKTEKFALKQGDFLTSLTGYIGRVAMIEDVHLPAALNQRVARMRVKSEAVLPEYLRFFFQTKDFRAPLEEKAHGAAQANVSPKELAKIPIPLPPLEGQKRVVAVLDQAFAALDRARAKAEANLADAEDLFSTTKAQVFTEANEDAEVVDLGEVASIVTTLTDPKIPENQALPHVGAGNMITGSDELVGVLTAKEEGLKSGKFPFTTGVVLYSKIRPYLKKVARPEFDGLCSADVYPLTPSDRIDRDYLFHLLLSDDFTEYAIKGSARAGMPKVNQNHLFAYRFGLPSLETQREAVAKIDAAFSYTSRLKLTYQNKMQDLDDLRQSILQKAFAGDLG